MRGSRRGNRRGSRRGKETGEETGKGVGEKTGEETGEGVGEETREETGEGVGEETGEGVGEETGEGVGEETGEGVGEETGEGASLQGYSFMVFAVVCILAAAYLYAVLPETKNKTFVDISRSFAKINGVEADSPVATPELEASLATVPGHEATNGKAWEMESSF
ncbi:hypothetical protein NHX12_029636 [Muraenolepis orangiensis]|uniref:Uncharacterized protein n=1 Tax=Muraenolepis orangiensis TaxID=630683 RepID=A0A9Q0E8B9_9TELE|nr:hypothetical protein NHX12_029636 [Muraenolepis orangiensis]